VLKGLVSEYPDVREMVATTSGKLRITYGEDTATGSRLLLLTIDPATRATIGEPLAMPGNGVFWAPDDDRAVAAIDNGVLRYGYGD